MCIFGKCSKFSTDRFLFFGVISLPPPAPPLPPLPPLVVWTNCVAQRPLSQYEKVCSLSFFSPSLPLSFSSSPPLTSLSKHSLIVCVFLNAKDNMSVYFSSAQFRRVFLRAFNLKRMIFFFFVFFSGGAGNQCFQLCGRQKGRAVARSVLRGHVGLVPL